MTYLSYQHLRQLVGRFFGSHQLSSPVGVRPGHPNLEVGFDGGRDRLQRLHGFRRAQLNPCPVGVGRRAMNQQSVRNRLSHNVASGIEQWMQFEHPQRPFGAAG